MIDLNAAIADELSYHIDRVFQETNINSATKASSVYTMARNAGFKVPGPKGAMALVTFACTLPVGTEGPQWEYAPTIKRGTKLSSGSQYFEVMSDVDFSKQFDEDGISNRLIYPVRNSNNVIINYKITKTAMVVAGDTRIYKKTITSRDIVPFMEITIPIENVMNVESVLVKDGVSFQTDPTLGEFYDYRSHFEDKTGRGVWKYFEVDSLSQQEIWGEELKNNGEPLDKPANPKKELTYITLPLDEHTTTSTAVTSLYEITRGEWKTVTQKYITEFTDNGYLKIIFGAGTDDYQLPDAPNFAKYQMSKMINNNALGVLPSANTTVFILYRVGGGKSSNVSPNAINKITYLNVEFNNLGSNSSTNATSGIKESIKVDSSTASVSGKDMPTVEELRNMIKYYVGAQERCVTIKDYVNRVLMIPPKYGTPFRVSGAEGNNKVMLYLLGINAAGNLDTTLPEPLITNIVKYLDNYRMINDFVEIKSGRIINLSFDIDMYVDKNYNKSDVASEVIKVVKDYMDVNKHDMGDDIFVGDIEKEISKVDGVINVIDIRVFNEFNGEYSPTKTNQEFLTPEMCYDGDTMKYVSPTGGRQIDLELADNMLIAEGDSMFEIKYPQKDIRLRIKER